MLQQFHDYLFTKHILVQDAPERAAGKEDTFSLVYTFARLFGIRITSGGELLTLDMVRYTERMLGVDVPKPFYQSFPQSVKALSSDMLLFDQLLHYFVTYGVGDFTQPGHSLFEEGLPTVAFKEDVEVRDFVVLTGEAATEKLRELVKNLLDSTRPLSPVQYGLVRDFVQAYGEPVDCCACKLTAIRLLLDTGRLCFGDFISLADVIQVAEQLNYDRYNSRNIKKLNLRNQDRKLLNRLLDRKLADRRQDTRACFEKRALWRGLLHHIHYKPKNDRAQEFVAQIRGGKNLSVYAGFERELQKDWNVESAVRVLSGGKGAGAVLRNLNCLLSRCSTESQVAAVLEHIHTTNPIILWQLIRQYHFYDEKGNRTFTFPKFGTLVTHRETPEEKSRRLSVVPKKIRDMVTVLLQENLAEIYRGKLGKVYVDEAMKGIALPIQEVTSMGGFGTLTRGSRLPMPPEKKLRAFTCWEKVDDIDLSVIGITYDGLQREFSWRSMYDNQSEAICFSGDQTSGYHGGSEYFDINIPVFREKYPHIRHLVFCNNVYSDRDFSQCLCKAGYMLRDTEDSGEIFEPKTVQSSFTIDCDSTFAYLFGLDLDKNEFVWLNVARSGRLHIAGLTTAQFLSRYFELTAVMNVYDLMAMLATELVSDPAEADVVVTDEPVTVKEGAALIHSYDNEPIMALMNNK